MDNFDKGRIAAIMGSLEMCTHAEFAIVLKKIAKMNKRRLMEQERYARHLEQESCVLKAWAEELECKLSEMRREQQTVGRLVSVTQEAVPCQQ